MTCHAAGAAKTQALVDAIGLVERVPGGACSLQGNDLDQPQPAFETGPDAAADTDEGALLAAVRGKDERACAQFVRRYGGRMLATATRLLNDSALAEDCVQESFLIAFRSLDRFEGRSGVGTWLHRITVNACLMKLRARKRKAEEPIDDLLPVFDDNGCRIEPAWTSMRSADDLIADQQVRAIVIDKIGALPDTYRIVLMLRDIEELDTREVAEVLEISEGAVKVRLHRARAALKKLLEPVLTGGAP